MDACTCHLCGEAMEPDVVLAQGDTCELCYLLHVLPGDFELAPAADSLQVWLRLGSHDCNPRFLPTEAMEELEAFLRP